MAGNDDGDDNYDDQDDDDLRINPRSECQSTPRKRSMTKITRSGAMMVFGWSLVFNGVYMVKLKRDWFKILADECNLADLFWRGSPCFTSSTNVLSRSLVGECVREWLHGRLCEWKWMKWVPMTQDFWTNKHIHSDRFSDGSTTTGYCSKNASGTKKLAENCICPSSLQSRWTESQHTVLLTTEQKDDEDDNDLSWTLNDNIHTRYIWTEWTIRNLFGSIKLVKKGSMIFK